MNNVNSDLITTVARLEKQLRMLRLAFGAVVLVVGGVGLVGWAAPQQDTMNAQRYMVLDTDGIPRGMFGVLGDGASVGMMFTDHAGSTRVELRVDPDGSPRVALMDDQERVRTEIGIRSDGSGTIVLADDFESPRLALSVGVDGAAQMLFLDEAAIERAMIGLFSDGLPGLIFSDAEGTGRAILQTSDDGAAQWRFFSPDGTTERATVGVYADGRPVIRLSEDSGQGIFFRMEGMLADTLVTQNDR